MAIEQAIYGGQDAGGYRFLARSAGFPDEWLPLAEQLCTRFGERPAGVSCPECVFARPFGPRHVAVVQVADQGRDDAGRPGALGFRLLVVPQRLYSDLGGDPFLIAEAFPPPWEARGELSALEWAGGAPPKRTVEQIQRVLDGPNSPTLLGGAQALLDGGWLVFERRAPDTPLLRSLWALLPVSSRVSLWPASFAFSNALGFHAVVVPRAAGPEFADYVDEAQAGDYPEGRYELSLQTAVEAGDQAEMDALFARRSRAQVLRLGVALLLVFLLVPLFVLQAPVRPPAEKPPPAPREGKGAPGRVDGPMELPPANVFPKLNDTQRADLAERLHALGKRLGVDLPEGDDPESLSRDLAELDARIDARLGAKRPRHDPGRLSDLGPVQRQLRALLWKHGVADYNVPGPNPVELVEKLEKKLAEAGALEERPREE
jgi:hypothetical protein